MAAADGVLIQRSQQGDLQAFDRLVATQQDRIYHLAYRITGNFHDAQDATQEAFLKAYRALPQYRHGASFQTWLYRIATNAALDVIRRRPQAPPISLDEAPFAGHLDDPDDEEQRHEVQRRVHRALAALSPEHRTVVLLRDFEGLTYDEIAVIFGIPVGTVRSRLSRAREALRPLLSDLAPHGRSGED